MAIMLVYFKTKTDFATTDSKKDCPRSSTVAQFSLKILQKESAWDISKKEDEVQKILTALMQIIEACRKKNNRYKNTMRKGREKPR